MQSKRILISLLTVLLICFLAGTATVSAMGATPSLELTVDISCSDAVTADPVLVVQPGDTLTVSVAVEGNPGFTLLQFALSYNTELLEVVTDDNGIVHTLNTDVFGDAQLGGQYNLVENIPGKIDFVYLPFGAADVTSASNTELFELSFTVKEGAHGDLDIGLHNVVACDLVYDELASTTTGDVACVHTYADEPASDDATCIEPGTVTYTCADCGEKLVLETEETAGHSLTLVPAQNATCEGTGNIAYYECTVCGKNFKAEDAAEELTDEQLIAPANGHTLVKVPAVAPTCVDAGVIEHWDCSVCGKNFNDEAATTELTDADLIVATAGHNWVVDEAVEPTYSAEGKTEGKHCDVCGEVLIPQDVIPQKSLAWLWILIAVVVVAAAGVLSYFFIFKKKVKRY